MLREASCPRNKNKLLFKKKRTKEKKSYKFKIKESKCKLV